VSYTKGPWIAFKTGGNGRASAAYYIEDDTGRSVAHIKRSTVQPMHENALLIAAAPDLLEALEGLMNDLCGQRKSCGHDFTCTCAGDKANEAIAKAKGEASR